MAQKCIHAALGECLTISYVLMSVWVGGRVSVRVCKIMLSTRGFWLHTDLAKHCGHRNVNKGDNFYDFKQKQFNDESNTIFFTTNQDGRQAGMRNRNHLRRKKCVSYFTCVRDMSCSS